jgi:hypothetical protein
MDAIINSSNIINNTINNAFSTTGAHTCYLFMYPFPGSALTRANIHSLIPGSALKRFILYSLAPGSALKRISQVVTRQVVLTQH